MPEGLKIWHDRAMSKIQVFGIPNCSSVKKARLWLEQQGVPHDFHDFKKEGVKEADLQHWLSQVGWEVLLNRKGTTWRKLDASVQQSVVDAHSASQLMLQSPSLIKRPVWVAGQRVLVGVNPEAWSNVI
jgi:Spx/MgsR family transcriptional regulator